MKKIMFKLATLVASFAFSIGIFSVNSASVFIFHQPRVPEALEKYRK